MTHLHLLRLKDYPIFSQLQLEEALLRADERNWCIFNEGSPPAIVMGISGKPDLLINASVYNKNPVPLIKRFSGGGTVFVDSNTIFCTFICNVEHIQVSCCPKKILEWTERLYHPFFQVKENDYVIGNRKCGGNAQYMRKNRWLHHSSLLWDFDHNNMDYLLMPPRMPAYREQRSHLDFLCKLKDHLQDKSTFITKIQHPLSQHFKLREVPLKDVEEILLRPHRKATEYKNLTYHH